MQIINLSAALLVLAMELPIGLTAGSSIYRSIKFRLVVLPLALLPGILLYQATNAVIYYLIAEIIYFGAYKKRAEVRLILFQFM